MTDTVANQDSISTCLARAELQNAVWHWIAVPMLNIYSMHQMLYFRDIVLDVQVGRTEEPSIFEMPDICTASGEPIRFLNLFLAVLKTGLPANY